MKLLLSRLIVERLEGPGGGLRWRSGKDGHAVTKTYRVKPAPRIKNLPSWCPEYLYKPDVRSPECDTWKIADRTYSGLSTQARELWRKATHTRATSPYDAYMRYAIPTLLRGVAASPYPPPIVRTSADAPNPPPYPDGKRDRSAYVAYPTLSLDHHGLTYLTWRQYHGVPRHDDTPLGPHYAALPWCRSLPVPLSQTYRVMSMWFDRHTPPPATVDDQNAISWLEGDPPVPFAGTRALWMAFLYTLAAEYPTPAVPGSKTLYYQGQIEVRWLGPGEAWHSWPLAMPSRRDTPQGPPPGWPPPIVTTEDYTYTLET